VLSAIFQCVLYISVHVSMHTTCQLIGDAQLKG